MSKGEKLTRKQKSFADKYIETGEKARSVLDSEYKATTISSAAVEANRTLKKAKVQAYIEEKAEPAASMIFDLSQNAKQEPVRLNASKDILDRAGFKPIEKNINLNINARHLTPKEKELRDKYEEELMQMVDENPQ